QVAACGEVRFSAVISVDRMVEDIGFGCSVTKCLMAQRLDLFADNQGTQLHPQGTGQVNTGSQEFPGDASRLPFGLLDKDPDIPVPGNQFSPLLLFLVDLL